MDDNKEIIEIIPNQNLETENNLISQRNESIQNKVYKFIQHEQQTDPISNEINKNHVDQNGRKNSFIKFMRYFDEYKNDNQITKLKSLKLNRAQTILYDDVIQREENELINEDTNPTNCFENIKKSFKKMIMSKLFSVFATIAIIVILFLEDLRVIAIHKNYDTLVDVILLIIIVFIFLEISLFILLVKRYRFSFFFWLDLCSFCSLIPDILLLFIHDEHLDYFNMTNTSSLTSIFLGNTQLSKTSRASVSGTKAGRLVGFIKTLKLFSILNVGKAYKFTVDKMLKNNESLFFEDKLKEIIKLCRRKSINLISNKDKVFFFKQIHSVLNNPDIFKTIKYSNINKDIIDDYYNYVMTNEKDKLNKFNIMNPSYKKSVININTNQLQQQINDKTPILLSKGIKNLNKFKTINNFKSSSQMRQQLFELVNYINIDKDTHPNIKISPEKEKKQAKLGQKNFKNYTKSKTLIDLMKKNINPQEKALEFIETIKENIDAEDENSIVDNENQKFKRNESDTGIKNKVDDPIIILNENKSKVPAYNRYSIQLSKPIISNHKKFSIESYRSGKSDLKICLCSDNQREIRNSLKKDNKEKMKKMDENIKKSSSLLTETTISKIESFNRKISLKKEDLKEVNDRNSKLKFEMVTFQSNKRLSSIQFQNVNKKNYSHKRESEGFINFNKLSQSIIEKLDNQNDIKKSTDKKDTEISKFNLKPEMRKSKTSSHSSKKMSILKNDIICKTCGGIVFKKYNKNTNIIHKKTFLDLSLSNSESDSSSSEDDQIQKKYTLKESETVIENNDKFNNPDDSDSGSENFNFDNLPELNIRYLTFENMRTPKIALALSKRTTIKVILIILCLLFSEPFFMTNSYINSYIDQYNYQIKLLDEFLINNKTSSFIKHYDKYFNNVTNFNSFQLNLFLQIGFNNRTNYCNFFPMKCIGNINNNVSEDVIYYENSIMLMNARRTQCAYVEFNYLFAIYDVSWFIKLGSILSLLKIFLVAFMLWIGSFTFLKDVYDLVVKPLEYISKKITLQQNNLEKILQFNDDVKIEEELIKDEVGKDKIIMKKFHEMMETTKFTGFIRKNGVNLIKILGSKTFNYLNFKVLSNEMDILEKIRPLPYQNYKAIIMVIKIKDFNELINNFQENFTEIYSNIINIIDLSLFEYFGEISTINQDTILAIFDESKYLKSSESKNQLPVYNQPHSISIEKSDESLKEVDLDLHEEYHSFEGSKSYSINSSELFNEGNEEIKIESSELKNMNILALISALKIMARIRYNVYLKKKLNLSNIAKNYISLQISLEKGTVFQHILNTDFKVETIYNGKDIKKCLEYNKIMGKFGLHIAYSGKFYRDLEFLKQYSREIVKIDDPGKCSDGCKLYAFDIILDSNRHASSYMEKFELSKDNILKVRKEHTKVINENYSKFNTYNTMDPELLLVRPKKLNTFLKYYKHALKFYKENDYLKSLELIKYALTINPKDYRTKQLFNDINNKSNNF